MFRAPRTSHRPRAVPMVSRAKSTGSCPESLTVNQMPGCRVLIAAAEFSTRSAWPRMSIVRTAAGVTPIVSPNVSGGVARPGGARCSHAVRATSAVASMITWPVRIETILY